jgi:hypothetical protein
MMNIFSKHFDALQSAVLARESDINMDSQCTCGSGPASFRCEDCFCYRPTCKECLLDSHRNLPLHHVQKWTGTYFTRCSLHDLGLVIFLGHYGHRCPNAPINSAGRSTVTVHTNGIHETKVGYCHCTSHASEALQLTAAGLFPATMDQPETAFTFDLLNDYHVHTL